VPTYHRPSRTYLPDPGDVLGASPDITDPVFVVVSRSNPELPAGLTAGEGGGEGTITSVNGDEGPAVTLTAADVDAVATNDDGDGPQVLTIECYTESGYAAIVTPDANTLYVVVADA
jgi:hypothetical protein